MNEPTATVISDPKAIERYRLKTIEVGLRLESKGMRHSKGSVTTAARAELVKAKIKPERNKVKLHEQFKTWLASLPPLAA